FAEVATAFSPIALLAADFNKDGNTDLAVLGGGSAGNVQIIRTALSASVPSFTVLLPISAGSNPSAFTVGDVNRDTFPDLVIATASDPVNGLRTDSISALLNNGAPGAANGFGAPVTTQVLQNAQ